MRTILLAAILAGTMAQASFGGRIVLTSPDHARTFAYGEMIWRQLYVDPANQTLTARITFSNLPFVGGGETRTDEAFNFRFPEVRIDPATQTLFARGRHSERIKVATFKGNPAHGWIDLGSGAKIYLIKKSGRVTALLTATDYPRAGMRWIQMDDNWSLQNLIAEFLTRSHQPGG